MKWVTRKTLLVNRTAPVSETPRRGSGHSGPGTKGAWEMLKEGLKLLFRYNHYAIGLLRRVAGKKGAIR